MRLAVERYSRLSSASKTIRVQYAPGVPTAEANYNGDLRFGSDRAYMTQRTALHEISHTLGVGQTANFDRLCASGNWPTALPLLRGWDGQSAKINCGGSHICKDSLDLLGVEFDADCCVLVGPYGLNYETEWSETNADRNVSSDLMSRLGV